MLNLRARSLVGSTREVQSEELGGRSIHSSRCGFKGSAGRVGEREVGAASLEAAFLEVGGAGPKSESESEYEEAGAGSWFGDVEGSSESGAGGREGPIGREGFD